MRIIAPLTCLAVIVGLMLVTAFVSPVAAETTQPQGRETLDAAVLVIIQATREEQDRRNAAQATRAAIDAEAARQRANAQATAQAESIQATRAAHEAARVIEATRQAESLQATRQAASVQAAGTRQAESYQATREASSAQATATAIAVAQSAEQEREAYRRNMNAAKLGAVVILLVFGASLGVSTVRAIWRIKRPVITQIVEESPESSEIQGGPQDAQDEKAGNRGNPENRETAFADAQATPKTIVVFDDAGAKRITELLEMQA